MMQGFPNSSKELGWVEGKFQGAGQIKNFTGEIFLSGEGNLRRSDFDDLNVSQIQIKWKCM